MDVATCLFTNRWQLTLLQEVEDLFENRFLHTYQNVFCWIVWFFFLSFYKEKICHTPSLQMAEHTCWGAGYIYISLHCLLCLLWKHWFLSSSKSTLCSFLPCVLHNFPGPTLFIFTAHNIHPKFDVLFCKDYYSWSFTTNERSPDIAPTGWCFSSYQKSALWPFTTGNTEQEPDWRVALGQTHKLH